MSREPKIIQSHVMLNFPVDLEEDMEDGGYTITCPDLPGCISEGDDITEAKNNMEDAIELYIRALVKESKERRNKGSIK